MEELDRYLAAHEHILEPTSTSSLQQQQLQSHSQSKFLPDRSLTSHTSKTSQRMTNQQNYGLISSSRKKEPIIRSKMISKSSTQPLQTVNWKPQPLSTTQNKDKISQLSARAEFMKMEFHLTIDQFMNSYLEEWRGRRKLQFR
jgi:hypothetical protein